MPPRNVHDGSSDIREAEASSKVVALISGTLGPTDLTTESSDEYVHARLLEYFSELDWNQADVLPKVIQLLDADKARYVTLRALSKMARNGSGITQELARLNPILIKLVDDHPEDLKSHALAFHTMARSTVCVVDAYHAPDLAIIDEISVKAVLKAMMTVLCDSNSSPSLLADALDLVTSATKYCPQECKSVPGLLSLLVAFLRSSSITTRSKAVWSLMRYVAEDSEPDTQVFNPHEVIAAVSQRFPDDISAVWMEYGPGKCDTVLWLKNIGEQSQAMMRYAEDSNLVALGRTLATLIVRAEMSIAEGTYRNPEPWSLNVESEVRLPFTMWTDALPLCAKALRESNTPGDLDIADILELKFLIIKRRIPEAISTGERAIGRNPGLAYAYYAMSFGGEHDEGLAAAKQGLKCGDLTPFVRNYLLWRAVEHGAELGLIKICDSKAVGDADYSEGIALVTSALRDASIFLSESPPDGRHVQTLANWWILLQFSVKGPELSEDLKEMEVVLNKLAMSTKMLTFCRQSIKRTQNRLARELALELYRPSTRQWGDVVRRFDVLVAYRVTDGLEPELPERSREEMEQCPDGGQDEAVHFDGRVADDKRVGVVFFKAHL